MSAQLSFSDEPTFQDRLKDSVNRSAKLGWFITFPRSGDLTKDQFLRGLKKLFAVDCACIVTEPHKDGEPHLHAQIRLKTSLTKIHVLQPIQKAWPDASKRIHVKAVPPKSWKDQLMYIIDPEKDKECDPSPLYFNLQSPIKEHITPLQKFDLEHPQILAQLLREAAQVYPPSHPPVPSTYRSDLSWIDDSFSGPSNPTSGTTV